MNNSKYAEGCFDWRPLQPMSYSFIDEDEDDLRQHVYFLSLHLHEPLELQLVIQTPLQRVQRHLEKKDPLNLCKRL